MEGDFKWVVVAFAAVVAFLFGGIFFSDYLAHQRDMACIQKGGTPANRTCLFAVRAAMKGGESHE